MTATNKPAFLLLLILVMAASCMIPLPAAHSAAASPKDIVLVDKNGSSFIPLRVLNELSGTSASWDASLKRIDIAQGNVSLTLFAGQNGAYVNENPVHLAALPFSDSGTVYVPLAAVSNALKLKLQWDKETASVRFTDAQGKSFRLPVLTGALIGPESSAAASSRRTFKVGGKSFTVQIVTVSLLHPKVRLDVVLAGGSVGKVEELRSMAKRSQAIAAINGTFFNAYTSGSYKAPYGYIAAGGKLLKNSPGDRRAVFAYDSNHLAELVPGGNFMPRFQAGEFEGGLQAGPRLVTDGKVSLNVTAEGFRDPKILTGGGARSALGLTRDHKLLLVTSGGATIPQMAQIMKQAGAWQAMNLDGGASSGLYFNGGYLTTPGRLISNAIVIKTQ
ncbi:phosphodiester glycosidase family protein [Paenibacillus durus]